MSRAVAVVALLAAAGAAAWFLTRPPAPGGPVALEGAGADEGGGGAPAPGELAAGPASVRTGSRVRAPKSSGAAVLTGVVRRGGVGVAARVAVHYLSSADANPFSRRGAGFFQRLVAAPPTDEDAAARTRSGEDGRYTVEGLGDGTYEVRAEVEDGARGSGRAVVPLDGARVECNVDVVGGDERLSGRVVRSDGSPWTGIVLVEAGATGRGMPGILGAAVPTRTDAAGAFEAKGFAPGEVTVTAIEPGAFRVASAPVRLPRAEPFVLTIDAALVSIAGHVVAADGGQPIAGATVTAGGQSGGYGMYLAQQTTGADGAFALKVPAGDRSGVMVTAEGFAPLMKQGQEVKAGEPLDLRLVRSAKLVGRITRASDGQPVAGATVRATSLDDRGMSMPPEPATTGADGAYVLPDAPSGDVMVLAQAPGLVTKGAAEVKGSGYNPLAVTVKPGETTTVDLALVAAAKASGTVTDSAGAPVAGAVVTAVRAVGDDFRRRGFGSDSDAPRAVSAADGSFALDVLMPGAGYTFTAECAGFAICRSEVVTATETAPAVVKLQFAAVRMADVTVLDDASGTPVAGARIVAYASRGGGSRNPANAVTGADGHARLGPLEPGEMRLNVQADDYLRDFEGSKLADGELSVVLRLKRGLVLAGKVTMPDGSPAVGAGVQIEMSGNGRGWVPPVTTGADGAFRFRGVAAGTASVTATLTQGGKKFSVTSNVAAGSEDATLALVEGASAPTATKGAVSVHVLAPDGTEVSTGTVMLSSGGSTSTTYLSDGRVQLALEGAGARTLSVWGVKSRNGAALDAAPFRRALGPTETDVEVRLTPGFAIEGVVKGPDGQGLKGVLVSASPRGDGTQDYGDYRFGAHGSARTEATGAFRIPGLGDGEYVLSVDAPAEFAPYESPGVRGGTKGVDISLEAGLSAVVTVLDWAGKPVSGARVSLSIVTTDATEGRRSRRTTRSADRTTDAQGVARLSGLAKGVTYRMSVSATDALQHEEEAWTPADVTIRLERAYTISGVVRDGAGKPVPGANVQCSKDKQAWSGTQAGDDGRFSCGGLTAGEYYVKARIGWGSEPADGAAAEKDTQRVPAGAKDVVLTVDAGLELVVKIENWPADGPTWHNPQLSVEGTRPRNLGWSNEQIDSEGKVRFRGLRDSETYRLWIPPIAGGLSCVATGLRAGGAEVRVRLTPGKSITGRINAPAGASGLNVSASAEGGGYGVSGTIEADGRYRIEGLPEGSYAVYAHAQVEKAQWYANGKAAAGGTLDLDLKKRGD